MPVRKDASGRRSIQVEIEVPGTLEHVWQAIATGPGLSAWFVPARFEEGPDGAPARVILDFGPGMESVSAVTAWEPLKRFAAESRAQGPAAPPMLDEWSVEARSGGTCVVRIVHSMATTSDAWDKELESMESGWPGFFRILRLYLTHFRGLPCSAVRLMAVAASSESEAWNKVTSSLQVAGAKVGQQWHTSSSGMPPLAGIVEHMGDTKHPNALLLRMDKPAPGIAAFGAFSCAGMVMVSITFNFYGGNGQSVVTRDEPLWQKWMSELFPAAAGASS